MMKRYSAIIWAIAALLLASCTHDLVPEFEQEEGFVLSLMPSGIDIQTKTTPNSDPTRPGNWDGLGFHENDLGSQVDLFFFRNGAGFDTPSVYNVKAGVNQRGVVSLPVSPALITTIFGSNIQGSKAKVMVVANYNGDDEGHGIDHTQHYTVNQLRALNLATADFKTVFPQEKFVMISDNEDSENPSPLVTITLTNPTSATPVNDVVMMKRIAAKVTFRLTVADEITVVNVQRDQSGAVTGRTLETWTPQTASITAYMQYAFKTATLGGSPQTPPHTVPLGSVPDNLPSIFAYDARPMVATTDQINRTRKPVIGLNEEVDPPQPIYGDEVTSPFTVYEVTSDKTATPPTAGPFYTYPVTWTPGAAGEPFIKLIIPWKNANNIKYYYYKVPFKKAPLESNHWYEMTIDVQILGGEDTNPVPLEANYKVVDWVPGPEAVASIESARYLSVPKTEWIMYNTDELTIPITSSHDVQIVGYQVKSGGTAKGNAFAEKDRYDDNRDPLSDTWIGTDPQIYNPFTDTRFAIDNTTTVGTIYAASINFNQSGMNGAPYPNVITTAATWFAEAEVTRDHIILRHTLNNNMSTNGYDIAPYYVKIRIQHKDEPTNYYKDILIEQRPAIMIDAQFNSGGTDSKGYVYVNDGVGNGTYGTNGSSNASGNNTNDYMYIITTTVLPTTGSLANYILGDPRSLTGNNLNTVNGNTANNWSADRRYVGRTGNQTRRLSANYYPSIMDETGDNIIAPKLRIASSHGKTTDLTYANAIRRCASYQEDGYPAGRWRVPTYAEIMYMAQLNTDRKIPRLLGTYNNGSTTDYWCNSGYVTVSNGNSTADPVYNSGKSGEKYVRCVYDEWYWENTEFDRVTKDQFTWGDQAREDVVRTKALY